MNGREESEDGLEKGWIGMGNNGGWRWVGGEGGGRGTASGGCSTASRAWDLYNLL